MPVHTHNPDPEPGIGRVEIPRPDFGEGDEEPIFLEDLRELVVDSAASFHAVRALGQLLRGDVLEQMDAKGRMGVAVLLEGVENRLALVLDGMVVMASNLGLEEARALT
nr:hypothetical protein [uncultured Albidiferax sp.]